MTISLPDTMKLVLQELLISSILDERLDLFHLAIPVGTEAPRVVQDQVGVLRTRDLIPDR